MFYLYSRVGQQVWLKFSQAGPPSIQGWLKFTHGRANFLSVVAPNLCPYKEYCNFSVELYLRVRTGEPLMAYQTLAEEKTARHRITIRNREQPSLVDGEKGFQKALPEDCFIHIFSYLSLCDLSRACSVNRAWNGVSQDPSLWQTLDLSSIFFLVDDRMLGSQLKTQRFRNLQHLSLEGCTAITSESIHAIRKHCPHLKTLLLIECSGIDPYLLLDLVHYIPLERLELYEVTGDFSLAGRLKAIRPELELGFFWLQYCAVTGLRASGDDAGHEMATCRYEGRTAGDRACWGRIRGRIIYSNQFYHRAGNYPVEVSYACDAHRLEDGRDNELFLCEICERYFRQSSMWPELICRTCFDHELLTDKHNWISLNSRALSLFDFSDVVSKTLRLADRKNLPPTLGSMGTLYFELDYKVDQEQRNRPPSFQQAETQTLVPINVFLDSNRWRVSDQVATLSGMLRRAARLRHTRALLLYDKKNHIEVLADSGLILKGRQGEELMSLTLQAWTRASWILYPFMVILLDSLPLYGYTGHLCILRRLIQEDYQDVFRREGGLYAYAATTTNTHDRAEQGRSDQSRAEQSRAEQIRADQSRAEQIRAEQSRTEQSRAELS
eukprot:g75260.t1